jgi:hypothetical protein
MLASAFVTRPSKRRQQQKKYIIYEVVGDVNYLWLIFRTFHNGIFFRCLCVIFATLKRALNRFTPNFFLEALIFISQTHKKKHEKLLISLLSLYFVVGWWGKWRLIFFSACNDRPTHACLLNVEWVEKYFFWEEWK